MQPAWTRERYEYDMADRITAAAAAMRHASRKCGVIESKAITMSAVARDEVWRYWNARRALAANEITLCVRGMVAEGFDADPRALGEFLREKYREMLRNEREHLSGRRTPRVFVFDEWLKDLDIPEAIALAPNVIRNHRRQFERPRLA